MLTPGRVYTTQQGLSCTWVVLLNFSTLQRPVLPLDVSANQGPELHMDVSGQQGPLGVFLWRYSLFLKKIMEFREIVFNYAIRNFD